MAGNNNPGSLYVIEGPDYSGKETQATMLVNRFKNDGRYVATASFPQYGEVSCSLVEEYLRKGMYGSAKDFGPYRGSICYTADRLGAIWSGRVDIRKWLKDGMVVILDRYTASNDGHQGGKIADTKERESFFRWLHHLEFGILGLPQPDMNFILKVDLPVIFENLSRDPERKGDIHENDKAHLVATMESYLHVSKVFPRRFKVIECFDNGKQLHPHSIHEKIWSAIQGISKF